MTHIRWIAALALAPFAVPGAAPARDRSRVEPVRIVRNAPTPTSSMSTVYVRLEGSAVDTGELLRRLNEHGRKRGLGFAAVDEGFHYRIAVLGQAIGGMDFVTGGGADAYAAVLGPQCDLVFIVAADRRVRRSGAVNAVAEQIVKRLPKAPATVDNPSCSTGGAR